MGIRQRARDLIAVVAHDIALTGSPNGIGTADNTKLFQKWVGLPPKGYDDRQDEFERRKPITFCNQFAGEFMRSIIGEYGSFALKAFVLGKKPYAWIDVNATGPKVGDILGYTEHLSIARAPSTTDDAAMVGGILFKIEAGQGGSDAGQDFLNVTSSPYPPATLMGWLDLDKWEYGPDAVDPATLALLKGVWTVWGDNRRFRWAYTFNTDNESVTWRDVFNGETGAGKFLFKGGRLEIRWNSGASDLWELPLDVTGNMGSEFSADGSVMGLVATKP